MNDLISRQAAIDALEEPREILDSWTDEYAVGERMQWEKDVKALNSLPSVQPEIVRCKDCKHRPKKNEYSSDLEFPDDECICQCADYYYDWMPEDDFYCARGERRSEDD